MVSEYNLRACACAGEHQHTQETQDCSKGISPVYSPLHPISSLLTLLHQAIMISLPLRCAERAIDEVILLMTLGTKSDASDAMGFCSNFLPSSSNLPHYQSMLSECRVNIRCV